MPSYVDTHAHIHDTEFAEADAAIERARGAGVTTIVTLGVNRADSERAIALAERYPQPGAGEVQVLAAAGVHPHDAKDASDMDLDALEDMAAHPPVVMVGEIGLDFYRDLSPRDVQVRVLQRQLETAARVRKPISLHARAHEPHEVHDVMFPLLERWSHESRGSFGAGRPLGVMHYFAGDATLAARYVELGFLISVHTSVTHPKAALLQSVAREAPIDALVIETDSPYGAPQRYRGKRNEPAYAVEAAAKIAELRGIGVNEVAGATTANALRLLGF